MKNYNIEGGIDFFAELYKSLDIEESEKKTEDDENKCLITNEKLTDKHIQLTCGHKFNYIPLYNDLLNHKKKFNYLEGTNSKLSINELRCPYCRKKQSGVLPYYEELGVQKINGVNFYDPLLKEENINVNNHKCVFNIPNSTFNSLLPESVTNVKFVLCGANYATKINVYNKFNPTQQTNYGDDNLYCYSHKKQMINYYKIQEKEKQKEAKIQAKVQIKAEKEKAKQEAKAAKIIAKLETKAAKIITKKQIIENIVLGPSVISTESTGCVEILKTGINKGTPCGCKIFSENMCKRHYLLVHKELILNN